MAVALKMKSFVTWAFLIGFCASANAQTNLPPQPQPIGSVNGNNNTNSQSIPRPPRPPRFDCKAHFPGSHEWTLCFQQFQQDLANFQHQIQEYTQQMQSLHNNSMDSSTSSFVNGYKMRAQGLNMMSTLSNHQLRVLIDIGLPQSVERRDDQANRESKWIISYVYQDEQNHTNVPVTKWFSIIPPHGVGLEQIQATVNGETLLIVAPDVSGGSSFTSSSSSTYGGTGSASTSSSTSTGVGTGTGAHSGINFGPDFGHINFGPNFPFN